MPATKPVTVVVQYELGHAYTQEWAPDAEGFCPFCGHSATVWTEDDPGDYYLGPTSLCVQCGATWTWQPHNGLNWQDAQVGRAILDAIKQGDV